MTADGKTGHPRLVGANDGSNPDSGHPIADAQADQVNGGGDVPDRVEAMS
jgi:hypothetical protein